MAGLFVSLLIASSHSWACSLSFVIALTSKSPSHILLFFFSSFFHLCDQISQSHVSSIYLFQPSLKTKGDLFFKPKTRPLPGRNEGRLYHWLGKWYNLIYSKLSPVDHYSLLAMIFQSITLKGECCIKMHWTGNAHIWVLGNRRRQLSTHQWALWWQRVSYLNSIMKNQGSDD
jgi:hypothetical protein